MCIRDSRKFVEEGLGKWNSVKLYEIVYEVEWNEFWVYEMIYEIIDEMEWNLFFSLWNGMKCNEMVWNAGHILSMTDNHASYTPMNV